MNAEIICVGTELLMGEVVNTNAAFLGEQLAKLGIDVYHHTVVGDNRARLIDCVKTAFTRSDIIITSGGLGPTPDDITKEVVSECFGLELSLDEECLSDIKAYFAKHGKVMTESNVKQAMIPVGAKAIRNKFGTAPGVIIEKDGKRAIMLPGPPNELTRMFPDIVSYLESLSDSKLYSRMYHIFGIGESRVAEILSDMMNNWDNPTVAPYAKTGEVHLRVCAKAKSEEEADALIEKADKEIRKELNEYIYSIDGKTLAEETVSLLIEKGLKISATESCTGGMFAKMITDVSGASEIFYESYVTYSNEAKMKILGVKKETLEAHGAVSYETAYEMAAGVKRVSGADIGVSFTGIAGPGGGTDKKPVGLVYIGVAYGDEVTVRELRLSGERERVRYVSCLNVLDDVRKIIKNL